ncbi:Electron transport protein SCO1/SenC [Sterolibacterium denitrificans]|uniref:Electron transport protein SCO1/SenC n=1 Tax=Sterolibacterium denitrificans TaxID=157592 RepID=A0A7Z7HNP9_9PROT|nr:Electron transport protein SCO1/SenC [Sterolibacterium denitrificans]
MPRFTPEKQKPAAILRQLTVVPLVLSCLLLYGCDIPPASSGFHARPIDTDNIGRDFSLVDHHGQPRRLADYRGKIVVLFFGYTQCPDVCPTTLATMAEVMQQLGADAGKVQVLFITLDPARDTRELLAVYVPQFHPDFVGLSGDTATTAATAREFHVYYRQRPGSGDSPNHYSIDHTANSYVYDPQGRLRLLVKYGETAEHIAADIRLLLAGK